MVAKSELAIEEKFLCCAVPFSTIIVGINYTKLAIFPLITSTQNVVSHFCKLQKKPIALWCSDEDFVPVL